ncbi:uncharacterized protein LTR77_007569 [Saxophila tyrrhenica]|uniref:Uncharacterized protein n=1 Tax=Saxophila tyrrhenica TaxID=1690608 RepID=A0AAV9P589_9PEZI|nr:hypothetical protein LTR77_007569 [Saxophila tyrrhenica]
MAPHFRMAMLASTALIGLAASWQQSGPTAVAPIKIPDVDLDHSIVFESVRDRLQYLQGIANHVKTLPPCAQLATSALLHTCSALEGFNPDDESELKRGSDLFIDEEADIYSARLAVCELNSADYPVPDACKSFVPSTQANKKRGTRGFWGKQEATEQSNTFQYYDEITQANLKQCRKALGASTQAWTSYSNNRQNAHLYCRAVRSEIEKDNQIHIGKVLANTAVTASESLQDAFEQFNDLKAEFSKLATAMPQFQMDLAAGNEQQIEHIKNFWAELERAHEGLRDIATGVHDIRNGVQWAKDDVAGLSVVIANTAGESAAKVKNGFESLRSGLINAAGDIEALTQLVAFQREKQQQEFITGLGAITGDISVVNKLMTIHQQALWEEREASDRWIQQRIEKEKEYQNMQKETTATLIETSDRVREVNFTLAALPSMVGFGWEPLRASFDTVLALIACASVYTLLSFGLWERCVGFSFIGNAFAAIGSGIGTYPHVLYQDSANIITALAYISVFTYSPLGFCRSTLDLATTADRVLLLGIAIGAAAYAVLAIVKDIMVWLLWRRVKARASAKTVEYDPCSPDYPVAEVKKWDV